MECVAYMRVFKVQNFIFYDFVAFKSFFSRL